MKGAAKKAPYIQSLRLNRRGVPSFTSYHAGLYEQPAKNVEYSFGRQLSRSLHYWEELQSMIGKEWSNNKSRLKGINLIRQQRSRSAVPIFKL